MKSNKKPKLVAASSSSNAPTPTAASSSTSAYTSTSISVMSSVTSDALIEIESDSNTDEEDQSEVKGKKINPPHSKSLPKLHEITSASLKTVCQYNWNKNNRNPAWICPCSTRGHNLNRLIAHVQKQHAQVLVYRKMLALEQKRPWNEDELIRCEEERSQNNGESLDRWNITNCQDNFIRLVQDLHIENFIPITDLFSPAFEEFIDGFIQIIRAAALNHVSLSMKDLLRGNGRTNFTKHLDERCNQIFSDYKAIALKEASIIGCTLQQDGRSNQCRDPLIATGVQVASQFIPLGTVNAGAAIKDNKYILELAARYLDNEKLGVGFADFVYAWVLDGAPANIKAMKLGEEKYHLVVCRCQSHGLALLLKKIFTKCFEDETLAFGEIIDYVRQHPRVEQIVKTFTPLTLFRFVETRFNTHPVAIARVIRMKEALLSTIATNDFIQYEQSLSEDKKGKCAVFKANCRDSELMKTGEFLVAVTTPISCALRLMDRSNVRSRHGLSIWKGISTQVASVLVKPTFSEIPLNKKKQIYIMYRSVSENSYYKILGAGYVLDPKNIDEVRQKSAALRDGESLEFKNLKEDTLEVLKLVLQRRCKDDISKFSEKWLQVRTSFIDFLTGSGDFRAGVFDFHQKSSLESYYAMRDCLFSTLAIIILNMAITASDVERLHKVYSLVHTPSRNRLNLDRVDRLSLAHLALRDKRKRQKNEIKDIDGEVGKFLEYSLEVEEDLIVWGNMYHAAAVTAVEVNNSLPPPIAEAENRDAEEGSSNEDSEELEDEEAEPNTGYEDPSDDVLQEEALDKLVEDVQNGLHVEEDEEIDGVNVAESVLVGRNKRKVVLSSRFLKAAADLGLTSSLRS